MQDALSSAVDRASESPGEVAPAVLQKAKLESVKGQNALIEKEGELNKVEKESLSGKQSSADKLESKQLGSSIKGRVEKQEDSAKKQG